MQNIQQTIERAKRTLHYAKQCEYAKPINPNDNLLSKIEEKHDISIKEIRRMLQNIKMCKHKDVEWNTEELERRIYTQTPHSYHWRSLIFEQEDCVDCWRIQGETSKILDTLL